MQKDKDVSKAVSVLAEATCGLVTTMDEDTRQLIRQLCTRAGMIMENASAIAILAPQEEHLTELRRSAERVCVLLAAADVLRAE